MVDGMGPADIIAALKRLNISHDRIGEALNRDRTVATKLLGGKRGLKAHEIAPLLELIREEEDGAGEIERVRPGEKHRDGDEIDHLPIEVMPSFAGMGGGGTGDGDRQSALLPRSLIEDQLHAKPSDLLLIDVRGDSMQPDFEHGDQILVDRRDCDPRQPGSFALHDGDGYVVKLIERVPRSDPPCYRIFSANARYSDYTALAEEVQIMGRPVWFARRL